MLSPYRAILRERGALAFCAAGLIARAPMSTLGIGIVLLVQMSRGSYTLAGAVSAAYVIAQAAMSPLLARLVDRHGQAKTMRPAVVVSTIALVALVAATNGGAHPVVLFALAAILGSTIGSFGSLIRARWARILPVGHRLHTAFSLESALDEFVFIVGPMLVTLLATAISATVALIFPLVALVVGAGWLLAQRATEPPAKGHHPDASSDRSLLGTPGVLPVLVAFIAMGTIFGANEVSTVALSKQLGHPAAAGVVLAVFALGSMLSGLVYGTIHHSMPVARRFVTGMAALAIGVFPFVFASNLVVLSALMFVAGIAITPTIVDGNALMQALVPRRRLTEGLTWVGTSIGAGHAVGAALSGAIIDRRGAHGGFWVVAGAGALALIVALGSWRVLKARAAAGVALDFSGPRHVVVAGVSGSGKSTVAAAIAAATGRFFIEADEFHPQANVEKMTAGQPLTDADREPWLALVREAMEAASRPTVVACSALRVPYRDQLSRTGDVWFALLEVPADVARGRVATREDHFMPESLVASQLATLEPLEQREAGATFSVDGTSDDVAEAVHAALRRMESGA